MHSLTLLAVAKLYELPFKLVLYAPYSLGLALSDFLSKHKDIGKRFNSNIEVTDETNFEGLVKLCCIEV